MGNYLTPPRPATIRKMREHPWHKPTLLLLLIFLSVSHVVAQGTADCSFPDTAFITTVPENISYNDECVWGCKAGNTGRGCDETCNEEPECGMGERLIACDPPRMSTCVACRQGDNEARDGGYSFHMYNPNNQQYELLHSRGSFESAKLYPSTDRYSSVMLVRDAVRDVPISSRGSDGVYTPPFQKWNDVMFTADTAPVWDGVGTIELQYSTSLWEAGASRSDVFMRLIPLYAQFTICNIVTSSGTLGFVEADAHTRGLLYEFRYRQLVTYEEDIEVTARFKSSRNSENTVADTSYKLPPTSIWTLDRRLFDYTRDTQIENSECLQIGFTLRKSRELLVDDIRVFSNLFWNSKFTNPYFNGEFDNGVEVLRSWDNPRYSSSLDNRATLLGGGVSDSEYVTLPTRSHIKQTIVLKDTGGVDGTLAAVFLIDIRGTGNLDVIYDTSVAVGGRLNTTHIVHKNVVGDDFEYVGADTWRTLMVPINLEEANAYHAFKIEHSGAEDDLSVLHIDNVILFVDNERCPVKGCDDSRGHVFVNGNCEPCVLTTPLECLQGEYITGCTVSFESNRAPICAPCSNVLYADTTLIGTGNWFLEEGVECSYNCGAGFWYSRNGSINNGPTCEICTAESSLHCNVGWYVADCGGESDRVCVPCHVLSQHESAMVYNNDLTGQCDHICVPNRFSYEDSKCFACTESVCGVEKNGFTSLRILDGFQYTSKCTATRDSQCVSCHSEDDAVHLTTNGVEIGHWCGYECKAGNMPCPVCEWDASKATEFIYIPLHTYSVATNGVGLVGEIPFNVALLVRIRGSVRISTAAYGTTVSLMIRIVPVIEGVDHKNEVVLTLTPLVTPTALAVMRVTGNHDFITNAPEQLFDVTVDMRSFVTTHLDGKYVVVYELAMSSSADITTSTVNDFVVETMNVSTVGCCNTEMEVDPSKVIRCQTCEIGINMHLPHNAYWHSPDDCGWACNTDYDLLPDSSGCEECPNPDCGEGLYWDGCGVCSECNTPAVNAKFSGPGVIRYDNTSCPTSCLDGFYYHQGMQMCLQCTAPTVLNCSVTQGGPSFELACGEFEDTKCVNCRICQIGSNASTPCTTSTDTVCTKCNQILAKLPTFGEWTLGGTSVDYCAWKCPDGLQLNSQDNICFKCNNAECSIGQYPTECTQSDNYEACKSCQVPTNAFALSVGSTLSETSCRWECIADYHYNATTNICDTNTIVVPTRIIEFATVSVCSASICGWGWFPAPEFAQLSSTDDPPCADRCNECPKLPVIVIAEKTTTSAVHTRKGSCSWVCMTPFMQVEGECVSIY